MSPLLERNLVILVRLGTVILAGLGLYLFIRYFWPLATVIVGTGITVASPLIISYLVALILSPAIDIMERKLRINRTWGTALALFTFLALIGGLLFLLLSNLIRELLLLYQQLTVLSQGLGTLDINMIMERLRLFLIELHLPADTVQNTLNNYQQQIFNFLKNSVSFLLSQLFFLVLSLPHYLFLLIVTIIASYFFARDYQILKASLIRIIPDKWQVPCQRVATGLQRAMRGYVKAQLFIVLLTGLQSLIGLSLLGVNYAHILAMVAMIGEVLPIFGIGALYIPWAVWLLFTGNLRLGIGLLLLYGIIVFVRQLIEPRIIAQNIGLHPLTVLIALYMGFMLVGFWGLILGPATVIAYKAFFDDKKAGS